MTIWLNLTVSYFWPHPPSGIIRAERELFAALARKTQEPLRYCVFIGGEFYEVDPDGRANQAVQHAKPRRASALSVLRGAAWEGGRAAFYHLMKESRRAKPALQKILEWRQKQSPAPRYRTSFPLAEIKLGDRFLTVSNDGHLDYPAMFSKLTNEHGARIIGFCHDLLPVNYPEFFTHGIKDRMEAYFRALINASSMILCNSVCTQSDVLRFIEDQGLFARRIAVVPLGCNLPEAGKLSDNEVKRVDDFPFILFVSTIERRKNHRILYEIYAEMASHVDFEKLPKIYMVGATGWRVKDLLDDIELNERVTHKFVLLNNVSDAMLAALYRDALFCVYPSFYEGWGLPVSEALAFGKAVIASNAGALPEASGGCALHLSPYDTRA